MPTKKQVKKSRPRSRPQDRVVGSEDLPDELNKDHSPSEPEVVQDSLAQDVSEQDNEGDPECPSCKLASKKKRQEERRESEALGAADTGRQGVYDDDAQDELPDRGSEEVQTKRTRKSESL